MQTDICSVPVQWYEIEHIKLNTRFVILVIQYHDIRTSLRIVLLFIVY